MPGQDLDWDLFLAIIVAFGMLIAPDALAILIPSGSSLAPERSAFRRLAPLSLAP